MLAGSRNFKDNAHRALHDADLQAELKKLSGGFSVARANAAAGLPEFEDLRDAARDIKDHTLANLDFYLERFEAKGVENGGKVHWCRDAEEARQIVLRICRDLGARTVTKGKTMIGEEIGLNDFLEANGVEPVETDLGEYIIQLRQEPPSHIIAPAIHVTTEGVAKAFRERHAHLDPARPLTEPRVMLAEARSILRERFLAADVGITGANFLIAETGSSVIVTNEGNGDLTQTLPKAHIVLASLEKVIPTLEDLTVLLRVLARSATGQEMSVYTTLSTGPRRPDDPDGPGEYHVVLLDNGRSAMVGTEFQDMLRCIRCGACMNHCVVFRQLGGHVYGGTYPGPMGAVLTPVFDGLERSRDLPHACTMNGKCQEVCPVAIPLPTLLRGWRDRSWREGLEPSVVRFGLGIHTFVASHPRLYRLGTAIAVRVMRLFSRGGVVRGMPGLGAWTAHREFPAPAKRTFMEMLKDQEKAR